MGTKRPCAPDCGTDNVPTSTHPFQSRPTKRLRPNTSNPHPAHSGAALNPIKAKIRDVTRLLKRSDDLPPGVRIEKERALAGHRQDLAEAEAEKRRQHMIGKYHMVRFFDTLERQKATRNLKKLNARIAELDRGSTKYGLLQTAIHEAEVDINYALYHPLDQKYHSLYPRNGANGASAQDKLDNQTAQKAGSTRPPIWNVVEECMADGTLEALRDGRLRKTLPNERSQRHAPPKTRPTDSNKKVKIINGKGGSAKKNATQERCDESDGGFFEE